jgi:hypothetical protein
MQISVQVDKQNEQLWGKERAGVGQIPSLNFGKPDQTV